MEKHFELTDSEFEYQFSDHSLHASLFTHEAHLRLAWIHIRKYGLDRAIDNITTQLRGYVITQGVSDKYNQTVTIAAVRAVYHFMLRSGNDDFARFITRHSRLKYHFKELMSFHYITNIFKSVEAKEKYLEPELVPFD